MTPSGAFQASSAIILLGGMGLLTIAAHAAHAGVWSAALFIGVMGAALLSTVLYVNLKSRKLTPRIVSPEL